MIFSLVGFAAIPLTLSALSIRIFNGSPLHSNFKRVCQLTLLSNYLIAAALILNYLYSFTAPHIITPTIAAGLAIIVFIRLTLSSAIDGEQGIMPAIWSMIEPLSASLFISLSTKSPIPNIILAAPLIGAILAVSALLYLRIPDRDGISSLRLARGLAHLILEGSPTLLEESLRGLGSTEKRVTDVFVFKGKKSGKLSAIVVLPFHMGPFRRMGSSLLNWLIESKAEARALTTVTLKGCTTHRSDIISSSEAEALADEIVSEVFTVKDGWSGEARVFKDAIHGEARGVMLGLSGRRLAVISMHPTPMEDIPEEIADFADEHNLTVIDAHNSFSPKVKRLSTKNLEDIQKLIKKMSVLDENASGPLKFSISRAGFGGHDSRREIGPCGYSLLAFEVDRSRLALAVIDGNNALPWVAETLRDGLRRWGWSQVEVLTTDTHSLNGVVLGGRGYYPVGENTARDELLRIFEKLSEEASSSLEEVEVSFLRIRHSGVRLFTDELFKKLADRVRKHATVYLAQMIASALLAYMVTLLL